MSFQSLSHVPVWTLLLFFASGIGVGWLYFRGLWEQTRRFTAGGRVTRVIALMLGRFALLGGVLTLTSFAGALPLLIMALGVLIARPLVLHRVREAAP